MTSPDSSAPPSIPLPTPSPETLPFWRGAKERRLLLPRCGACEAVWFPPSLRCPRCLSESKEWVESCGLGAVHSFVVVHRVYHPAFAGAIPYIVAVVELDEGPRLLTNLIDVSPQAARCGMRVRAVFVDLSEDIAIPKFEPYEGADQNKLSEE